MKLRCRGNECGIDIPISKDRTECAGYIQSTLCRAVAALVRVAADCAGEAEPVAAALNSIDERLPHRPKPTIAASIIGRAGDR
jgi:hypothetical protein